MKPIIPATPHINALSTNAPRSQKPIIEPIDPPIPVNNDDIDIYRPLLSIGERFATNPIKAVQILFHQKLVLLLLKK